MRKHVTKGVLASFFVLAACSEGAQDTTARNDVVAEGGSEGASDVVPAEGGSEGAAEAVPAEGGTEGHSDNSVLNAANEIAANESASEGR